MLPALLVDSSPISTSFYIFLLFSIVPAASKTLSSFYIYPSIVFDEVAEEAFFGRGERITHHSVLCHFYSNCARALGLLFEIKRRHKSTAFSRHTHTHSLSSVAQLADLYIRFTPPFFLCIEKNPEPDQTNSKNTYIFPLFYIFISSPETMYKTIIY